MGGSVMAGCWKCDYGVGGMTGVGMLYPHIYDKTYLPNAKAGKFGKCVQRFLEEHPEGAVNFDLVVKRCEDCGEMRIDFDLGMYLPAEKPIPEDEYYEDPRRLYYPYDKQYVLYKPFDARCGKCHGRHIRVYTEQEFIDAVEAGEIRCPRCGEPIFGGPGIIDWD